MEIQVGKEVFYKEKYYVVLRKARRTDGDYVLEMEERDNPGKYMYCLEKDVKLYASKSDLRENEFSEGDAVTLLEGMKTSKIIAISNSAKERYKILTHDGLRMWVYGYELKPLIDERQTDLNTEDYYSIISLAIDLGDKDLLDTYKDKVKGI